LFAFTLLGGCKNAGTQNGDPLVGDMHPKSFGNAPPPAKTSSSKGGSPGEVPALPTATSTGSAAAIVTGDPLTGGHPLNIDGPGGGQPVAAWQGTKLTAGPSGGDVTPNLRPPVEVRPLPRDPNAGAAPTGGAPAAPAWSSHAAAMDFDRLQQQLKERNVTWHRLETVPGGYKFSCTVPKPFERDVSLTYEATGRDYQSAILAVLEKIDAGRPQH
jgi:hypothetical protein